MINNNVDKYHYKCFNCGIYILKSNQFQHDIICQSERKMFDKIESFLYKCKICRKILNEMERYSHLLFHQSNRNENINSNFNKNNSSDTDFDGPNINNNTNANLDMSTITLGRNNNNIIFNIQNNNNNNRRNRRSSMENNAIRRPLDFDASSSSSDSEDIKFSKDLGNNSNNQNYIISKIKDPKKLSENKQKCLICLEKFRKGENTIILPCLHIFHSSCIKKWMEIKNFCPLCKKSINSKKKHKKYI